MPRRGVTRPGRRRCTPHGGIRESPQNALAWNPIHGQNDACDPTPTKLAARRPGVALSPPQLHSFRIAKLEVLAESTGASLADATGFFCEFQGRTFLVTNWHVVAGRHYQTHRPLHRSRALPGKLVVHAHLASHVVPIKAPSSSTSFQISLFDAAGRPCWLEHPLYGHSVDVIAIEMDSRIPRCSRLYRLDLEAELARDITLSVMDQAFVTGYPLSASTTPNSLPIYKSGTIASEPGVFDSEPRIYIDGKTKTGMSGSPVMVKGPASNGEKAPLSLVGIYSGRDRQERTEFEAELGIMWPYKECLVPILEAYVSAASVQTADFSTASEEIRRHSS